MIEILSNFSISANVSMKQRWAVQNHIKTVHAIAVCNLVEMTMGLIAEASIPTELRWLPMGMDVKYLKKATGKLTGTSEIDPNTFFNLPAYPGEVSVPVDVKNEEGVLVTKAHVRYALLCVTFMCFKTCWSGEVMDFKETSEKRSLMTYYLDFSSVVPEYRFFILHTLQTVCTFISGCVTSTCYHCHLKTLSVTCFCFLLKICLVGTVYPGTAIVCHKLTKL